VTADLLGGSEDRCPDAERERSDQATDDLNEE
jgi:hypothetical protein